MTRLAMRHYAPRDSLEEPYQGLYPNRMVITCRIVSLHLWQDDPIHALSRAEAVKQPHRRMKMLTRNVARYCFPARSPPHKSYQRSSKAPATSEQLICRRRTAPKLMLSILRDEAWFFPRSPRTPCGGSEADSSLPDSAGRHSGENDNFRAPDLRRSKSTLSQLAKRLPPASVWSWLRFLNARCFGIQAVAQARGVTVLVPRARGLRTSTAGLRAPAIADYE